MLNKFWITEDKFYDFHTSMVFHQCNLVYEM